MSLVRQISRHRGLPAPETSGAFFHETLRQVTPPIILLDADLLDNLLRHTGLDRFVSERLERITVQPVWTGKLLSEIRTALLQFELPDILRRELQQKVGPLLNGQTVDVATSPVSEALQPVREVVRGAGTIDEVERAIRQSWASLFDEKSYFEGAPNFTPRTALVIARMIPDLSTEAPRQAIPSGLIAAEEVGCLQGVELGACLTRFKHHSAARCGYAGSVWPAG